MPNYPKGHAVREPITTINVCGLCGFITKSKAALKLHKKFVHKGEPAAAVTYKCGTCSKNNFDTEEDLTQHLKSHEIRIKGRFF